MTFNPDMTTRMKAAVKRRIVKDPASRWADLSSKLARWGALAQGGLALLPAGTLTTAQVSIVAVVFFVAIGGAKLIAEDKNAAKDAE